MQAAVEDLVARTEMDGPALEVTTPEGHMITAKRVSSLGGAAVDAAAPGGGTASVKFPLSLGGNLRC